MGSLMAGWNSPVEDPKLVKLRRNSSSLTKEEIEAFWRSKKQTEEEHLREISALSPRTQMHVFEEAKQRFQRSGSLPLADTKEEEEGGQEVVGMESAAESFIKKHGWWISSDWAFLNEPPVIAAEGPKYKYAAQFHIADMASSKTNNAQTGVGA